MAPPVYSVNLMRLGPGDYGPNPIFLTTTGFVIIITHMVFTTYGGLFTEADTAFQVTIGNEETQCVIWQIDANYIQPWRTYQWEGREVVVDDGLELQVITDLGPYSFTANGYQLTVAP